MEDTYIEKRSCALSQCKCLCGGGACRLCCRWCPAVRESTSARAAYILMLTLAVLAMALMMSRRVQEEIMQMFPGHAVVCAWVGAGENCEAVLGYMAVYRLGLAITLHHLILMLATCRVRSSKSCRAGLHNGLWFYKVLLLLSLSVAVFFIPDPYEYFIMTWMYIAMGGAALYLVLQLVLLVFAVHGWTDKIVQRVNNGGSPCCWYGVVGGGVTAAATAVCVVAAVMLYRHYAAAEGCHKNQWFILVNASACIVVALVAAFKKSRTRAVMRLFQASLVSVYVHFLTWTALSSAPRSYQANVTPHITGGGQWSSSRFSSPTFHQRYYCGPTHDEMTWADEVIPYVSLATLFISVVYACVTTSRPASCRALEFPDCPNTCPEEEEGESRTDVEDTGGQRVIRDERRALVYSYSLFHAMLSLATLFMMMSLTAWYSPTTATLLTFGRSWAAVWIKMVSSWICLSIYLFTLLFPSLLPKRARQHLVVSEELVRSVSRMSMGSRGSWGSGGGGAWGSGNNGLGGSSRSVGRGYFGSNGSLGVAERLRRYSASQYASHRSSLADEDAVPLSPSKPATIVCHQETTV